MWPKCRKHSGLPLSSRKILDVGCGGGILAEGLARLGAEVTAIDPNEKLIKIAKERAERHNIENLSYHNFLIEDLQGAST